MGLLWNSGDIGVKIGKELGEAITLFASYDFWKDDRVSIRGLRKASTRWNSPNNHSQCKVGFTLFCVLVDILISLLT